MVQESKQLLRQFDLMDSLSRITHQLRNNKLEALSKLEHMGRVLESLQLMNKSLD